MALIRLPFPMSMPHELPGNLVAALMEQVRGIEPLSTAWKAVVMSHYTTPACSGCLKALTF